MLVNSTPSPSVQYGSDLQEQYLKDQEKITTELEGIRDTRANNSAWNAVKSGFWFTGAVLNQAVQVVGSFIGHLVTAVVVAPLATVGGAIYAAGMKVYDYATGRENAKSFFDYTLSAVQSTCKMVYNRATDWLCRYILGPAFVFTLVEPAVCMIGSAIIFFGACPFYFWDFKYNQGRNVEAMERVMMTNISNLTNCYIWDKFLKLKGTDVLDGLRNFWSGKKETPEPQLRSLGAKPVEPKTLIEDLRAMQPKLETNKLLPLGKREELKAGGVSDPLIWPKQRNIMSQQTISKLRPLRGS